MGEPFGASLVSGNDILDEVNARLPRLHYDTIRLTQLAEIYTAAGPDLWDSLAAATTTAATLTRQRNSLESALLAAAGFGNTGTEVFERAGPYLVAGARDLVPTAGVLDEHSPALYCTLRNYAQVAPRVAGALGSNGYSLNSFSGGGVTGAEPHISIPTTCRGSTPRAAPAAGRAAGSPSPASCGRRPPWCWTPASPSPRTTISNSAARCSSTTYGVARSGSTPSTRRALTSTVIEVDHPHHPAPVAG